MTLSSALARHASSHLNSVALEGDGRSLTYSQLNAAVERTAEHLQSGAAGPVALALENGIPWAIADLALTMAARPCLPVPPFFSRAQQAHAIRDAGAVLLITDEPERYASLLRAHGLSAARCNDIDLGGTRVARFELAPPEIRPLPPGTAKVTYTSGTTGRPKGVCLGSAAIAAVACSLAEAAEFSAQDRHLTILPLATLLENIAGLYVPLLAGARVILLPPKQLGVDATGDLSADRLAGALGTHRITTAITVPEMLRGLCAALERGAPRPDSLRFVAVGGAPVAQATLDRAAHSGLPVFQGYGLSECASVVALNTPCGKRRGSVGRPLPHARVRVASDGEIYVHGATLLGYAGASPCAGEWYATGDLGHLDADGFLFITGRKKNVFITSYGRNVAPEWVESELTARDEIAQAWVYGEGRPWNVAVITPARGASAQAVDEAIARANRRLPAYARVRHWLSAIEPFSHANGQLTSNRRLRRGALLAAYIGLLDELYTEISSDVS
jgi:long-subunit acyl-CoA synthetase (AMP-forming)